MRSFMLLTLCAASALAACDGENGVTISSTTTKSEAKGVLKVVDALQCPEALGILTRKGSANAGGTVCIYTGPRGAEVSLHLVSLEDEVADVVLTRFETMLSAGMPQTLADLRASNDAAHADEKRADTPSIGAPSASSDRASVRAPGVAIEADGERANVKLPGFSVEADGGKANVRLGGLSIRADDASETVDVTSSDDSIRVRAHDDAAEIRTRAPGDAIRTTYLLTDSRPADAGWRMVGYEARGPSGGPIVVATARAKERDNDAIFDAAKDLVTLNVGE